MKRFWRRWNSWSKKLPRSEASGCDRPPTYDVSWPPPAPGTLLKDRKGYERYLSKRRRFPENRPDTSLDSLYRLYEHVVLNHRYGLRNEIEYFWKQSDWRVSDIPDPSDEDPARYAILSCIPALLVRAFNRNIALGMKRDAPAVICEEDFYKSRQEEKQWVDLPSQALQVHPAPETIRIPHEDDEVIMDFEDERSDPAFSKMNILIWTPHIYFA